MKIFILVVLMFNFIYANVTISFEKGWNLIGVPQTLENMEIFNTSKVDIVWAYSAKEQKWEGYSPQGDVVTKIVDKNISLLKTLEPYQAIWVLSKEDWELTVQNDIVSKQPKNNQIVLQKGWNLVALPNKVIVSKDFFGDALVWKYKESWSVNDSSLAFPTIENIKESEGFWVYSQEDKVLDMGEELSKLRTFSSDDEVLDYIRAMQKSNHYRNYLYYEYSEDMDEDDGILVNESLPVADVALSTKGSAVDATTTNLQESDVDEADILKHNGQYIFSVDNQNREIFVTSFVNIAEKNSTAITTIKTDGDSIINLYLQKNHLIVLTQQYIKSISSVRVTIYDIKNITDIIKLSSCKIDGSYNTSRLVDGKLFMITNFYPTIVYQYDKIYTDDNEWRYDYKNPKTESENLIPYIQIDNNPPSKLITPTKFYAPQKLDQSLEITTVSSFDIEKVNYKESISIVGYINTSYASTQSFYLVSESYPNYYNYFDYKARQMIYKFSLGEKLEYKGRGFVEGRMLNQFSMSEKENYLRVATTQGDSWSSAGTDNSIFTLSSEDEKLEIKSVLSGLGKEGESIKAVRFMGDRAFVVTFKTTDPLYTLDLSDPLHPLKVGELSIPGYSSYLHIVDENRVLSIGRDADETGRTLGLQLQLFDVTDFQNPSLADKIVIGDRTTYSPAEYNHKAFVYRQSDNMFAVPYLNYNNYTNNLAIYQIDGMQIEELKTLTTSDDRDDYYFKREEERALIFDLNKTTYGTVLSGSHILSDVVKEN